MFFQHVHRTLRYVVNSIFDPAGVTRGVAESYMFGFEYHVQLNMLIVRGSVSVSVDSVLRASPVAA